MKKLILTSVVSIILLSACHSTAPSLAWESFDSAYINKKMSKKGVHGDYQVIFWQNKKGTYDQDTLDNYTANKHWFPANDGDRDSASMAWFYLTYHQMVSTVFKRDNVAPASYFNGGTLYTYTYTASTWIPGKSKITKNYVWVSADEDRMGVFTSPEFAYFYHHRYKYQ